MTTIKELRAEVNELSEQVSVLTGLWQSAKGDVKYLGSFAKELDNKWSADGIALKELDGGDEYWYNINSGLAIIDRWTGDLSERAYLNRGEIFKTEERAQLELDRQKVQYIMRKMASVSREDNDWRVVNGSEAVIYYDCRFVAGYMGNVYSVNDVYFFSREATQECLDALLEEYGEPRLKEIWGIKS